MIKVLFGKIFGDRGYISQELFQELLDQDIFMVTRVKKNIQNKLISLIDQVLFLKRALIEFVFAKIKLLKNLNIQDIDRLQMLLCVWLLLLSIINLSNSKPSIKSLLPLKIMIF